MLRYQFAAAGLAASLNAALPQSSYASTTDLVGSYGNGGVVTLPSVNDADKQDVVYSLQLAADGTGYVLRDDVDESGESWTVYRLTSSGSIDPSFSSTGFQYVESSGDPFVYHGFFVDTLHQRILMMGLLSSGAYPAIIDAKKFDGTTDTSFGSSGRLTLDPNICFAAGATFDSEGHLLVSIGCTDTNPSTVVVARMSPEGVLDTTFGNNGISQIQFQGTLAPGGGYYSVVVVNPITPVEVIPGGEIDVLANKAKSGGGGNVVVLRYPAQGYSTTQNESTSNEIFVGNDDYEGMIPDGNGNLVLLLDNLNGKTFDTLRIDASQNMTILDSSPEPSFAYEEGGQTVGLGADGSILIGGSGDFTDPSSAQIAKLVGNTSLISASFGAGSSSSGGTTGGAGGGTSSGGTSAGTSGGTSSGGTTGTSSGGSTSGGTTTFDHAPIASLTVSTATGVTPLTTTFDGSSSSDPDAGDRVETYQFDFGDGSSPLSQASPTASHIYLTTGNFTARLAVTDSEGLVSTNTASVLVEVQQNLTPTPTASSPGGSGSGSLSLYSLSGLGVLVASRRRKKKRLAGSVCLGSLVGKRKPSRTPNSNVAILFGNARPAAFLRRLNRLECYKRQI